MNLNRSVLLVIFVPLAGIAILVYEFAHPPWSPLRIAGIALLFPALALLTLARFQLGNSFSLTPQAKKLVTHGIYSRIRNPVYFFGAFVIAGIFLFLERPYLLFLLVPVLILQIVRARRITRPRRTFWRRISPLQSLHVVLVRRSSETFRFFQPKARKFCLTCI